jgi:arylsulfatase A-like enzyme
MLQNTKIHFVFIFILFLGCNQTSNKSDQQPNQTPNIVLLLLDDIGWNTLSMQMDDNVPASKSDFYQTPNLNKIARGGMRFTSGYASSPVCSPTRYAIQFGQSPAKLGKVDVTRSETDHLDHGKMYSLPKAIKDADSNYVAAHFGKWHIDVMPAVLGFDESDGRTTNREGLYTSPQTEHVKKFVMEDPKLSYSLSHRAADFIERQTENGNPFFLQVSYYANHTNAVASPEEFQKYSQLTPGSVHSDVHYAGMTADLDNGIGIINEKIKALGIEDNTYIIVLADNGAIPGFPPKPNVDTSFNYPLAMGKWNIHEGGIRVPFFIKGPGVKVGSQTDVPVISHDLLPTIATLVGNDKELPESLEGIDFSPILLGTSEKLNREFLVFHWPVHSSWEMITASSSIRKGRYKLIKYWEMDQFELFDLQDDISENNNLADAMPEKVQELNNEMTMYFNRINADTTLLGK